MSVCDESASHITEFKVFLDILLQGWKRTAAVVKPVSLAPEEIGTPRLPSMQSLWGVASSKEELWKGHYISTSLVPPCKQVLLSLLFVLVI